jgi:hypothetical protein
VHSVFVINQVSAVVTNPTCETTAPYKSGR